MSAQTAPHPPAPLGRVLAWLKEQGPNLAVEIGVNMLLPLAIYSLVQPRLGTVVGLIASSAPPLVWSLGGFTLSRRVDALSLLVLAGIAMSLIAFFGGGGPRFLQLRERLVMVVIGLVFLGSAAIGKPLIYQLARARIRRESGGDARWFEALRDAPAFRRAMTIMTIAWGLALVAEPLLCAGLVFVLTTQQYMIVNPILGYGTFVALTAWTWAYARRRILAIRADLS